MRTAIEQGWEEREVTVNRLQLLATLKANREKHIKEYNEAVAGYKEQATERLVSLKSRLLKSVDENFAKIQENISKFNPDEPLQDTIYLTNTTSFSLQVPRSYEKSYDVAIGMAAWEVAETVTLKQSQFQCFVLDDWEWKAAFQNINKTYAGAKF